MSTTVDILNRKKHKEVLVHGEYTGKLTLYEIIDRVTEHIFTGSTELLKKVATGQTPEEELERAIEKEIYKNGFKLPGMSGAELSREIKKHLLGYGPIQEFVLDENCSNIYINAPDDVWVQVGAQRFKTNVCFGSVTNLNAYIRTIQGALGGTLNYDEALVRFVDEKNRLRIICGIDPISHLSPTIVIRKHRKNSFDMADLCEIGMFDENIKLLLERIAHRGDISIMFTGKGGAGKTTLMRAMAELIDLPNAFKKRILVMEEHPELFLQRPQTVQFLVKRDRGRVYGIEHFTDYGNLMSIDLYLFGEIRGAEALPFFDGAFAGNITWNTGHSSSAERAIPKMAINMKRSGTDIDISILEHQLYESVDLIIHLDNFCVTEIAEVLKDERKINSVYKFDVTNRTATWLEGKMNKVGSFRTKHLEDLEKIGR